MVVNDIPKYCFLVNEHDISSEDREIRKYLLDKFRTLPIEVFSKLRHFQPQVGCFNRCGFCSQSASSTIIEFSKESINNIIAVIRAVSIENGIRCGYLPYDTIDINGELSELFELPQNGLISYDLHRKGVVYCYLDNDPSLYGDLAYFVHTIYRNLGVKTRIATVGFNRKNKEFVENFQKLSMEYKECLAGVRLSISSYTYGWSDKQGYSREEFAYDIGYLMNLFKEQFELSGDGRKGYCAEIRFKPLVIKSNVIEDIIEGHFVLKTDEFQYITLEKNKHIKESKIVDVESHDLKLSEKSIKVIKVPSNMDLVNLTKILEQDIKYELHDLHKLSNDDGIYYGIDVERKTSGKSYAKYIYPITNNRLNCGIIDGERYFLNTLIENKKENGEYNWNDVNNVIEQLRLKASSGSVCINDYINNEIIPLIETYILALITYGFSANCFFDKYFTVDTGHICNLGLAYNEYKLLASRRDLPMTPNHERTFGKNSDLAREGIVYRLAPNIQERTSSCIKNNKRVLDKFLIEKLDLVSTATKEGQHKNIYYFDVNRLNVYKINEITSPTIPGQV
ncbi:MULTISPECIES: hypothetical protein [unclassified Lonepinella]|uniref:hypothetical protein n=1 Tax=unclassified Lonepinella TaxID=2642006 RepID=UPI0036DCB0F9